MFLPTVTPKVNKQTGIASVNAISSTKKYSIKTKIVMGTRC